MSRNKRTLIVLGATLVFSSCSVLYSLAVSYFISLLYGNTITIYSLTIGSYMLFLGIGALFYEKISHKYGIEMLLYTELLLVLTAFFAPLAISWMSAKGIPYDVKLYGSFFILGIIGILSGIELPLLMGLEKEKLAGIIGIDYFGGLIGSLLYIFFFLPYVNTVAVFHYIAFFNLVTAVLFYYFYKKSLNENINYKMIALMVLTGIILAVYSEKIQKLTQYYFINKRLQLKVYL